MTAGVVILVGLVLILFTVVLVGGGWAAWRALQTISDRAVEDRNAFRDQIEVLMEKAREERKEQSNAFEVFMEAQLKQEQIVADVDKAWVASEESAISPDDDLNWEQE